MMRLFGGSLFLAVVCFAQQPFPRLSVGNSLEALTPQAAFRPNNDPSYALRSEFNEDTLRKISIGAQQFGLDLLSRISTQVEKANRDFMISPFSVWSLLLTLFEGAGGSTYDQLRQVLRINVDAEDLRAVYRIWSTYLKYEIYMSSIMMVFINGSFFSVNTSTIEVASVQALYTDKSSPIKSGYREAVQYYGVQPVEVDFYDPETVALINEASNRNTRGLIPYTVLPQQIVGAKMFMMSSLFFKGQWKVSYIYYQTTISIMQNIKFKNHLIMG